MGSYEEEIFTRAQRQFKNMDQMIGWLSSFSGKGGNAYEQDAVRVAEDLQKGQEIISDAESSRDLKQLSKLSSEANKLKFNQDEPLGIINDRVRVLEGELEEAKRQFKETEERKQAEKILRELSPQSLGGIKSGETRRAQAGLRALANA